MTIQPKREIVAAGFACLIVGLTGVPVSAVTAEVARKCGALMTKQFPPREPGNPAAGSAKGSGRDQQAYFDKCVANGGKIDSNDVK
ncbi:hypothetical protein [Bradyrhizobium commune]|uniref:hypothetical protein n=1 Tax=Bradyrhizobium commune TaxID=83627 RepID=UPI001FED2EF9|nr:hypothetical protein [Bradyrhizobium commune]